MDFDFDRLEKIIEQLAAERQEVKDMFKETDMMFKETDKKFQDMSAEILASNRKADKVLGQFTTMWGKLVESLVNGDLINLLKSKGIDVHSTSERVKGNHEGQNYEFDIIAKNGVEIVIVEVKTTLTVTDVKEFIEKLANARIWLKEYNDYKIYGAVAYLTVEGGSDIFAEKKGLFVIRATGSSASIVNNLDFLPKTY